MSGYALFSIKISENRIQYCRHLGIVKVLTKKQIGAWFVWTRTKAFCLDKYCAEAVIC